MMNAPKVRQHCRTQAEREAAKKAMLASATATFETHVKKAVGGQLKAPDLCDLAKQIVCALVWQLAETTSGDEEAVLRNEVALYRALEANCRLKAEATEGLLEGVAPGDGGGAI
jgi:hypothetical protein